MQNELSQTVEWTYIRAVLYLVISSDLSYHAMTHFSRCVLF